MSDYQRWMPVANGLGAIFQGLANRKIRQVNLQELEQQREHEKDLATRKALGELQQEQNKLDFQSKENQANRQSQERIARTKAKENEDQVAKYIATINKGVMETEQKNILPMTNIPELATMKSFLDYTMASPNSDMQKFGQLGTQKFSKLLNADDTDVLSSITEKEKGELMQYIQSAEELNFNPQFFAPVKELLQKPTRTKVEQKNFLQRAGDFIFKRK